MILLSGNIRFMRIFAGVPWKGASNDSGVVDSGFGNFRDKPVLLYHDTQSVVDFLEITECMTLNDLEWLFRVKFCFRAGLSGVRAYDFQK